MRARYDPSIFQYMTEEVQAILENDEICYREPEDAQNEYKAKLSKHKKQLT